MQDAAQWHYTGACPSSATPRDGQDRAVQDPDAGHVERARRDPARFLALYERHVRRIHGYVRLRIADPAAAEDVTSEVFLTALAKLGDFRGHGSFGAWLFRIAQNKVRAAYRTAPEVEFDQDVHAEVAPGPEEGLLWQERIAELRRLLAGLEPDAQDLLALRYGAGLPYDEIGPLLNMSAGAARVAVHRILEDLRGRYDR